MATAERLLTAATRLETAGTTPELWDQFGRAIKSAGIANFIYLMLDCASGEVRRICSAHLSPAAFGPQDPFLTYCCNDFAPTYTGIEFLSDYKYLQDDARAYIEQAAKLGLRSGVALATRLRGGPRRGGFNLVSSLVRADFEATIVPCVAELRTLCLIADRRLAELESAGLVRAGLTSAAEAFGLTARETEVLGVMAAGLSREECANRLGISHGTVSSHLKASYAKLGCRNLTEALLQLVR